MCEVLRLDPNDVGKDWFVGDIHGCRSLLFDSLKEAGFNFEIDRLFCTGDLVDRGSDSVGCLELLDEEWFFSVKGNHEDMMCAGVLRGYTRDWYRNGGEWYEKLPESEKERIRPYIEKANELPYIIRIGNVFAVAHADVMYSISEYEEAHMTSTMKDALLWGRYRINFADRTPIDDVDVVIVGHTPVARPVLLGNVLYIDTGACYGVKLTVLSDDTVLDILDTGGEIWT